MSAFLDDLPRPDPRKHEIGQDLSPLSIADIDERIAALEAEIERLRTAREAKDATRSRADSLFKL